MTGEKLRSLRRDHKPSKEDGDLLEPGEEEAAPAPGGVFTGGRGGSGKGGRAGGHRIFSNHHHRLQLKGAPAPATPGAVSPAAEADKCPGHFPVHECVFKGDVRRLSALIRTQGIGQKDSHGGVDAGDREKGGIIWGISSLYLFLFFENHLLLWFRRQTAYVDGKPQLFLCQDVDFHPHPLSCQRMTT